MALGAQLRLSNEKLEALEVLFCRFESKPSGLDDKLGRVLEITEGVSSSFGEMNISPEQVQGVLNSFGLTGQAGGSELVGTLQTFRSKLGDLSARLSQISQESEKI